MKRSFFLLGFVVSQVFFSPSLFSETTEHDSSVSGNLEGKKKRPPITDRLSEEELDFLSRSYFRAEASILERFDNKEKHSELFVPEGITAVQKAPPSEITLAKVLAELSGSLNESQLELLGSESNKLALSIRDQDPNNRDSRLLALAERSEWLVFILKGETPPSESLPQAKDERAFESFKREFLGALKEVNKKNKEVLALIEEARNGNDTAKKTLRKKLDMKSMPDFLKAQVNWGGQKLFESTAEALAHVNKEGYRYHDFRDPNGKFARVVAGKTPADHASQLSQFFKNNPERLAGYSLTTNPITVGKPELINVTGKPLPSPRPTGDSGSNSSSLRTSQAQLAKPIFQEKCVKCHKAQGVDPIEDFAQAAEMIRDGSMPKPPTTLTPAEKNTLLRFFLSSESKTEFTELTR